MENPIFGLSKRLSAKNQTFQFLYSLGQILFIKFSEIYNTLALKFEENRKIFSLIFSDILASAVLGLLFQAARTTQKPENNSHQPLLVGF